MGSSKTARKRRSATIFTMAFASIAIILSFLVTSLVPGLILRRQQQLESARLEQELVRIKAANARLREDVSRLYDPAYVEVLARTRYNMARKDEQLYRIIDVPSKEATRQSAPAKPKRNTWWDDPWRWFKDIPFNLRF